MDSVFRGLISCLWLRSCEKHCNCSRSGSVSALLLLYLLSFVTTGADTAIRSHESRAVASVPVEVYNFSHRLVRVLYWVLFFVGSFRLSFLSLVISSRSVLLSCACNGQLLLVACRPLIVLR